MQCLQGALLSSQCPSTSRTPPPPPYHCHQPNTDAPMSPTRQICPAVGPRPPAISTLNLSIAFLHTAAQSTPSGTCGGVLWMLWVVIDVQCWGLARGACQHEAAAAHHLPSTRLSF